MVGCGDEVVGVNVEKPQTLIDASGLPLAIMFGLKPELGLTVRRRAVGLRQAG